MATLAPELPGALELIGELTERGIVVSLGHTDCSAAEFAAGLAAGARYVTHLFNAMRPFAHRDPGPIGATLADDSVVAGLICDGIHVDPVAVRMAWRALGPDRFNLVTDAVAVLGSGPGDSQLGSVEVTVDEGGVRTASGVLAGSDLSLDRAVRNLVAFAGCSVPDAVRTVTVDPGSPARPHRSGSAGPRSPRRRDGALGRARRRDLGRRRRGGVEVVITATADDAARVVADVVVRLVTERPAAVLGLATGTSPLGAYRLLIEEHRAGRVSFAACHAVLLDEYVGLPPDHPEAYRAVIRREFTDHVDLTPDRLHGPDVGADDLPAACALRRSPGGARRRRPAAPRDRHRRPRRVQRARVLAAVAHAGQDADHRDANGQRPVLRFARGRPPPCRDPGLGDDHRRPPRPARRHRGAKAAPVARAVEGPLAAVCPASVLQLHPHATVVVDEAAAAGLQLADYYREAYAGKPAWQQL